MLSGYDKKARPRRASRCRTQKRTRGKRSTAPPPQQPARQTVPIRCATQKHAAAPRHRRGGAAMRESPPPWRSRAAPHPSSTRPPPRGLGRHGAARPSVVRAGVELKSAEVAKLDKGVRCLVDEERDSGEGKRRVRLINPIKGWASREVLKGGVGRGSAGDGVCAVGRRCYEVDSF